MGFVDDQLGCLFTSLFSFVSGLGHLDNLAGLSFCCGVMNGCLEFLGLLGVGHNLLGLLVCHDGHVIRGFHFALELVFLFLTLFLEIRTSSSSIITMVFVEMIIMMVFFAVMLAVVIIVLVVVVVIVLAVVVIVLAVVVFVFMMIIVFAIMVFIFSSLDVVMLETDMMHQFRRAESLGLAQVMTIHLIAAVFLGIGILGLDVVAGVDANSVGLLSGFILAILVRGWTKGCLETSDEELTHMLLVARSVTDVLVELITQIHTEGVALVMSQLVE